MIKKMLLAVIAMIVIILVVTGILSIEGDKRDDDIEIVIGLSQANMQEPWRILMTRELQQEAEKYDDIQVILTDAAGSSEKQIKDIDRLRGYDIDILVVSPCDARELTPVISEVYQQEIPVIVMDRAVEGFDYSLFIGSDNEHIGELAGDAVLNILGVGGGKMLELCPNGDSKAGRDLSKGLQNVLSQYSEIDSDKLIIHSETRDSAEDLILASQETLAGVDLIVAHNDYMALGAYQGLQQLGLDQEIRIIGVDGFQGEDGGLDLVRRGVIEATITRPTGGREAVQFAIEILHHVSGVPKQIILRNRTISAKNVDEYEAGLNRVYEEVKGELVLGYAQVGSESAWRVANTNSIQSAAKEAGIQLVYRDANQSQDAQIEAIREFIEMEVDMIALSPVVDSGWDEVFLEAKAAGIPIILSDRGTNIKDDSLYMTYLGADFKEEGRRAMRWITENLQPGGEEAVKIMEIQGTYGSSPMIERSEGFTQILEEESGYEIVYAEGGDFTLEGGRQVVENYLRSHTWDIDVIYSHNDDMALGAIECLKQNGIKPGVDVLIVSVDGTRQYFREMVEGRANFSVECSPLLGPQLMKAVRDYVSGKDLPLRIITDEKTYTQEQAEEVIKKRLY